MLLARRRISRLPAVGLFAVGLLSAIDEPLTVKNRVPGSLFAVAVSTNFYQLKNYVHKYVVYDDSFHVSSRALRARRRMYSMSMTVWLAFVVGGACMHPHCLIARPQRRITPPDIL